jgi:hypothetical protein
MGFPTNTCRRFFLPFALPVPYLLAFILIQLFYPADPHPPAPPLACLPASPLPWLACPASSLWSRPQAAGSREGGALAGGYMARHRATQVAACHAAPAPPRASLSQSKRSRFLAYSNSPPPGVSSERSRRLARHQASGSDRRGSGEK